MSQWLSKVKLKHLLTKEEDAASIRKSMNAIADVVQGSDAFIGFKSSQLRNIPDGDDDFTPLDYANRRLAALYDFADERRIWID